MNEGADEGNQLLEPLLTGIAGALGISGESVRQDTIDSIQIVGEKIAALVDRNEKVGFYTPAFIKIEGRSRPGALAFTETTLIVGYAEGATKLGTTYAKAVPLDSITRSSLSWTKIGPFAARQRTISLAAPGLSFDVVFNAEGNKQALFTTSIFLIRGVGSVVFSEEGEVKSFEVDRARLESSGLVREMEGL